MWSSTKIYQYRDFATGVYLSEAQKSIHPPPLHIVYVYTVYYTYLFTQGRGGRRRVEPERRLERQKLKNRVKNANITESISSL
jgi:hypothetical protein